MSVVACGGSPGRVTSLRDSALERLGGAPTMYRPDATRMSAFAPEEDAREIARANAPSEARPDASLDCVALAAAETRAGKQAGLAPSLVDWLSWRCGAVRAASVSCGWWAGISHPVDGMSDGSLARSLAGYFTGSADAFYGVAKARVGRAHAWGVAYLSRMVDVEPFPKVYALGATLSLRGHVGPGFKGAKLFVSTVDGATVEPVSIASDGAFTITYSLPRVPGRVFIEVRGTKSTEPGGLQLLWFPVYVGVAEPTAPEQLPEPQPIASGAEWADKLLAEYNRERARLGRAPLRLDPTLSALARTRSDQVAGKEGGETVAQVRTVLDMAHSSQKADWRLAAFSDSVEDLARVHLWTPSVRQTLLSASTTRVGIGATARPPVGDALPVFVVAEFWASSE
jgi:uncharacterized protein YkwD